MKVFHKVFWLSLVCAALSTVICSNAGADAVSTRQEDIAETQSALNNAKASVTAIINQPVTKTPRSPWALVQIFSPGWFHDGVVTPDFNTVDVRSTQEFPYDKFDHVTSDLNPTDMFNGHELEFNAMTKYFYTDKTLPKKRLSEAEMLEVNRLYRIIGKCNAELTELQSTSTIIVRTPKEFFNSFLGTVTELFFLTIVFMYFYKRWYAK